MGIPYADLATVSEKKITHYLLNPAHPAGGGKAVFFLRFGFSPLQWEVFAEALLRHAGEHEAVIIEQVRFGTRHVVDGSLTAPDGTCLKIRSVWFTDNGTKYPRLVTAHPLPKS